MADVEITYAIDNALATIAIAGTFNAAVAIKAIEQFYTQDTPMLVLIDFLNADVSQLNQAQLIEITQTVGKYAQRRKGGKTALVVPTDLKYGLGRMVEALYVSEVVDIDLRSFRTTEEAKQWLGVEAL